MPVVLLASLSVCCNVNDLQVVCMVFGVMCDILKILPKCTFYDPAMLFFFFFFLPPSPPDALAQCLPFPCI